MWYVYILQSENHDNKFYTDFTNNVQRRLDEHNSEMNIGYTSKYKLWKLHTYLSFSDKQTALNFEAYLKT